MRTTNEPRDGRTTLALTTRTTADLARYIEELKATTENYQSLLNAMIRDGITEVKLHDSTTVRDLARMHDWSMGLDLAYRRYRAALAGEREHEKRASSQKKKSSD